MNKYLKEELLLRKNKVIFPFETANGKISKNLYLVSKFELNQLGYTYGSSLEKRILKLSENEFLEVHKFIITYMKEILSVDKHFEPLLKRFQKSVDKNSFEIPKKEFKEKLIKLELGYKEDIDVIFKNLLTSKTNISESDKDFILSYLIEYQDSFILPNEIPLKENVGLLFKGITNFKEDVIINIMKKYINNATDILRMATSVVDGDVSLSVPCRFKLSNKERRILCSLLESLDNVEEDMKRWENRWKRLGEVIHIGTMKNKYPKTYNAFDLIRNNPKSIKNFYRKVEIAIEHGYKSDKAFSYLLKLLSLRPGEFIRLLDFILRKNENKQTEILDSFEKIVDKISTTVLLQAKGNFKNRYKNDEFRYFLPKGSLSKIQYTETSNRKALNKATLKRLHSILDESLSKTYSSRKKYKNVLIDKSIESFIIPFSMRSTSKSLNVLTRGSRVPFEESKVLRFFLWWKNIHDDDAVDIDLSAVALRDDFSYVTHIDYTNLEDLGTVHSGDITDAPGEKGASEFIDIDRESFINNGIRYVVMNVYSFNNHPFKDIECFAGVMERNSFESDNIYDALTVKHKYTLTGDNQVSIPLIIDLKEGNFIWGDLALSAEGMNSVAANENNVIKTIKALVSFRENKITLLDLVLLNLENRAENIHFEKEIDTEYDLVIDKDFISNIDDIMANWL